MFFKNQLKAIVRKGDTNQEYRQLFNDIVKYHRECFTEENLPTTQAYLQELLDNAITANSTELELRQEPHQQPEESIEPISTIPISRKLAFIDSGKIKCQ